MATVSVRDVQTGKELLRLKAGLGIATGLAFSPDGKRLANYVGKVWDVQTGTELLSKVNFSAGATTQMGFTFSPDGKRLAGCGGH